jgi:hypothetical protein
LSLPPAPLNVPLRKGALVTVDSSGNPTSSIVFQYNPATLRRKLQPFLAAGSLAGERTEAPRFAGASGGTITVTVQLDATDAMNSGAASSSSWSGIFPQLAAFELLLYPAVAQATNDQSLIGQGQIEIIPLIVPRTLFVWGPNRVVPVLLTDLDVTEELYDTYLNPLRAAANLSLRVLTYSDLDVNDPGYKQFLAYQQNMQTLAQAVTGTTNLTQQTGVTFG